MSLKLPHKAIFEYQTPATIDQAAPVQNTWYTLLDTTKNCRVYSAGCNIEDTNETLQMRFTVDGEVIPVTGLATAHSTSCEVKRTLNPIAQTEAMELTNTAQTFEKAFLIDGKSIKVELRKTTAAGVGNLTGIVTYGILKVP